MKWSGIKRIWFISISKSLLVRKSLIRQTPKQDIARLLTTDMQKYIRLNQSYRPSALRLAYTLAKLYEQDEAKAEQLYQQFSRLCTRYHLLGEIEGEKALIEYVKQL